MGLIKKLKMWAAKDLLAKQREDHEDMQADLGEQLQAEWDKIKQLSADYQALEASQMKWVLNNEGVKALSKTLPLNADYLVQLHPKPTNYLVVRVRLNDFGQPEMQVFNGTPLRGVPYAYAQIIGAK